MTPPASAPGSKVKDQVVFANTAACRDCYRCVRVCKVKAIRITDGQAEIDGKKCISCGVCIGECPQKAKTYISLVDEVATSLNDGVAMVASIAPAYLAAFSSAEVKRLAAALRKAGFSFVGETSSAAWHLGTETQRMVAKNPGSYVSPACPAVVSYVQKYKSELSNALLPLASPAAVHARMLKKQFNNAKVVFFSPCVAKKAEQLRGRPNTRPDYSLTFTEMRRLFKTLGISINHCEESPFDEYAPAQARGFATTGGLEATMPTNGQNHKVVTLNGIDELDQWLDFAKKENPNAIAEAFFCNHGCINGPECTEHSNMFERQARLSQAVNEKPSGTTTLAAPDMATMAAKYRPLPLDINTNITEKMIKTVLERTAKADPSQQLDCGACGYANCRANAVAVLQGFAEPEMCIPFMRRMAEQKSDMLVANSPNGIMVVNKQLEITAINPAFERMFHCSKAIVGKPVTYLLDPDPFEQLQDNPAQLVKVKKEYKPYQLVCSQLHFSLPENQGFAAVFIDMTNIDRSQQVADTLKQKTLAQAKELLAQQMEMSVQMARVLGENTAKSESLLQNLMTLVDDD